MYKLVIQDDEGKTTVVPLVREEVTIGRKEGNTIRLTERNVSRRHARIVRNAAAIEIEDLGSYNGVRVNGVRIGPRAALAISDRVQIGDYLLELKSEGADGKTTPLEAVDGPADPTAPMTAQIDVTSVTPLPGFAADSSQFPQAELDGADTTPLQRHASGEVSATEPQTLTNASSFARLVVVSPELAGDEYIISRPNMVIGRDPQNDIVIDHRALSRNHARISWDQATGTYVITDLESANGIRVNGQTVERAEVRSGDTIELGQLRLQLMPAGQAYSAMTSGDESAPQSRALLWIVAVAGAAALALVAWMVMSGDESGKGEAPVRTPVVTPTDAGRAVGADAAAPPVAQDAAPSEMPSANAANPTKLAEDFATLVAVREYDQAFAVYRELRNVPGGAAAGAATRAELETAYREHIGNEAATLAAEKRCADLEKLLARAQVNFPPAAQEGRRVAGDCLDGASGAIVSTPTTDSSKASSTSTGRKSGSGSAGTTATTMTSTGTTAGSTGTAGTPGTSGSGTSTGSSSNTKPTAVGNPAVEPARDAGSDDKTPGAADEPKSAVEALAIAREAQFNGFHAKAARYASLALGMDPSNVDALQILAMSNCKMGKAELARKYTARLPAARQSAVKQVCLSNGIDLQ